jgi:mannitol repressor
MGKRIKIAKRHDELPKPAHVHAMAEIARQTSRGAAIAATAYLDLLLRGAIETVLLPAPDIQASLFENRGPLQDFSARILVVYALKLIGDGAYGDLCLMRDIRNAFAHSAEAFEFDREDIAARCGQLWYPRTIRLGKRPMPETPRESFVRATELLAIGLHEVPHPVLSRARFIHLGPPRKAPAAQK